MFIKMIKFVGIPKGSWSLWLNLSGIPQDFNENNWIWLYAYDLNTEPTEVNNGNCSSATESIKQYWFNASLFETESLIKIG